MKKVLIIEDETPAADRLEKLVLALGDVEIITRLDSVEDSVEWFKNNLSPDLAFFDIQLADGKSFSIFDKVTVSCPVIFTTAFDEYAIKAFKVNSIDYLLKPIDETELKAAWEKYIKLSQVSTKDDLDALNDQLKVLLKSKQFKKRFLIKSGDQFKFLSTDKIAYFFSDGGNTFLVDDQGTQFLLDENLEALEDQLDPEKYHRVNRKFIICLLCITKIETYINGRLKLTVTPKTTEDIIVSRERVSGFKKWLDK